MIKIKNFGNYYFCPKKCEFYREKGGSYVVVRPVDRYKKEKTYILYKNGIPHLVKFWNFLKENIREIELSLAGNLEKVSDN